MLKTQAGVLPDTTCVNGRSAYKNMFGFKNYLGESYDGQCDFFGGSPPLPEGLGWFIVLGIGTIFACLTSGMVWFSNKNIADDQKTGNNSETFSAAGRTIPAGLTAADVVSKWTWAATLLQSSNVAYKFGVSGPFWYAAGATVQIILFAILAIEIKRKCPAIHTMLEVSSWRGARIQCCGAISCLHCHLWQDWHLKAPTGTGCAVPLGNERPLDVPLLRPFVFAHRDGDVDPRRRCYHQRPHRHEHRRCKLLDSHRRRWVHGLRRPQGDLLRLVHAHLHHLRGAHCFTVEGLHRPFRHWQHQRHVRSPVVCG